jgi:predicted ATPase/DNA-binding winged helix-turn-helix (wHTH) protein
MMLTLGDVEILPEQRQVRVGKKPFNLGSRAYDMLEVLAAARGELVSKDEIMRRVWPNTIVVENNLHVHISAIRKMLGDQGNLLVAVPGRGYRLAIQSECIQIADDSVRSPHPISIGSNLPASSSSIYGRGSAIDDVIAASNGAPLVTLVGPGGIGKTILAVEVCRKLMPRYPDGVRIVELSSVSESEGVASAIGCALGLCGESGETSANSVAQALDGKRILIVLDNCEHVIQAAAEVALALFTRAPACRVLATSREPLRVPGERVYRVAPLDVPQPEEVWCEALQRSAVQLFLNRARAIDRRFAPDAHSISLIGLICRRLDGMPLAIGLAAPWAATLGVKELAAHLDDRFLIVTGGHRTALPQHQTLRASFDWSYNLLPPKQKMVLRRLGVFPCAFVMEAACAVIAEDALDPADVLEAVCELTAKSLVVADIACSPVRYNLLETSRAYALQKLHDNGERDHAERRHLSYVSARIKHALASVTGPSDEVALDSFQLQLDDVRSALDWAFSARGDRYLGTELIAMTAPLFFKLGLFAEVRLRARLALDALDAGKNGPRYPAADLSLLCAMAGQREPGVEQIKLARHDRIDTPVSTPDGNRSSATPGQDPRALLRCASRSTPKTNCLKQSRC